MKRYAQMTPDERREAVELHQNMLDNQQAVRAREAAIDALAAYLKQTKRKRPAPSMLFQYPGFDIQHFRALATEVERLQAVEDATGTRLYRRDTTA